MNRHLTDPLVALATTLLLAVGVFAGLGASTSLNQPFPGFLVLQNRVIPSVGLSLWPGTAGGEIFQHDVVAVNGTSLESVEALDELVASVPIGTPLEYRLRSGEAVRTVTIETRRFGAADFGLLYGMYALNGLALGAACLVALGVRRRNPGAMAIAPLLGIGSLWALSALDLYGPYRLIRLHALCEAFLFPAALHAALAFPVRARFLTRFPWLPVAGYLAGGALAVSYQLGLEVGTTYVAHHLLAVSALGVSLLLLVLAEVERFRCPPTLDARDKLKVLALGALVGLALPVCLTAAELLTGGRSPANAMTLTGFVFALSIAYGLLRHDFVRPASLDGTVPSPSRLRIAEPTS